MAKRNKAAFADGARVISAAIAVGDRSKLTEVLDTVIAAAKAGELDAAIEVSKGENKKSRRKVA